MQSKKQDYQKAKTREILQYYKECRTILQKAFWYCEVNQKYCNKNTNLNDNLFSNITRAS